MQLQKLIDVAGLVKSRGPTGELTGQVDVFRGVSSQAVCGEDCKMLFPLQQLGFKERKDFADGGARSVFVEETSGSIFTYCERDLILEIPRDPVAGTRLLQRTEEYYLEGASA